MLNTIEISSAQSLNAYSDEAEEGEEEEDIDNQYNYYLRKSMKSSKFRLLSSNEKQLKCKNGYIQNGKCQCEIGKYPFYESDDYYNQKCVQCGSNCKVCGLQSVCTVCNNGYYPNRGKCYSCDSSCLTCTDQQRCSSCQLPMYLTAQYKCQECSLSMKQYVDKTTNICKSCDATCQSCLGSAANQCTKCAANYQSAALSTTSSTFSCIECNIQNGYFISDTTCQLCHNSCLTCDGRLITNCLTCRDAKTIDEDTKECVDCSKKLGYYVKSGQICSKCNENCLACEKSSTYCTSCKGNLSLKDNTCVDCSTQIGYYTNTQNKCVKCPISCATCSSVTTCTSCNRNYYWDEDRKNCVQCDTNSNYFINSDQCLKCHNFCAKCNSKDNTQLSCTACKSGYDWIQSKDSAAGITECGICNEKMGYYRESGNCKSCQNNCAECLLDNAILKCKYCKDIYYFDADSETTCIPCEGAKFIENNLKCKECHSSCKKCFNGSETGCEICADGYRRLESEKKCVVCDQVGQIQVSTNQCVQCQGNCDQCDELNQALCISCKPSFYLKDDGQCVLCTGNYIIEGIYCKACHPSCNGCQSSNPSQCTTCASGYLKDNPSLTDYKCILCSSSNFFNLLGVCTQCNSVCYQCDGPSSDNCTSCGEGHTQISGTCNNTCLTYSSIRCPCNSSCKYCKAPYQDDISLKDFACSACNQGFYLKQSEYGTGFFSCDVCIIESGHFVNGLFCEQCNQPNCGQCTGNGIGECTLCANDMFMKQNGECVECNQPGEAPYSHKCYTCAADCEACVFDESIKLPVCTKCKFSKKLNQQNICVDCQINSSYFIENENCLPCYPSCATCEGGNLEKHCKTCQNNLFFIEEKCQQCPSQNYVLVEAGSVKECIQCHNTCLKCSAAGEDNCTECQSNSYFIEDNIKRYCKSCDQSKGYYIENNMNCKKCDSPCATCHGQGDSQCDTCIENYALFEGRICKICNPNDQKYLDPESQICMDCDPSCKTCKGLSQYDCESCGTGQYLYVDGSCGVCDEVGENVMRVSANLSCAKCDKTCSDGCISVNENGCKKCQVGLSFKQQQNNLDKLCQVCPTIGYYEFNQECNSCHHTCQTCTGGTDVECILCKQGLQLMSDQTCQQCPSEFHFVDGYNKCLECPLNCKKCGNAITCLECDSSFQLDENTKQCLKCDQQSGYFIDNHYCRKCNFACKECYGASDSQCIDCNTDYYRINGSQQCALCLSTPEYILQQQNCMVGDQICSLCGVGSHLPFDISNNTSIISQLPKVGYTQSLYCLESKCIACISGYFNFNGICTSNCNLIGQHFVPDNNKKTCKCKDDFPYQIYEVFTQHQQKYCSKIVPHGYFCQTNNTCQECQPNCHTCKSETKCSYCQEGFYLWQGKCNIQCPSNSNLEINKKQRICECPKGHIQITPKKQSQEICIEPLELQSIEILNAFMSQRDDYMAKEVTKTTSYNNIIKFNFNRQPLDEEKLNFDILVNIDSLQKDKDYYIRSITFDNNEIIVETEVLENRRALTITYSLNGQKQTIKLKNAILTTQHYNKSQVGEKNVSRNIQQISNLLAPKNGKSKDLLEFFKRFQILCFLSNFVQVLGPITLLKDSIPPQVYVGAELGASFIFNSVPSANEIGYTPEQSEEQIDKNDIKYDEEDINPSPYSIMHGLGLQKYLYSNFMIVHLILDISSLLILVLLIARKFHPDKQYSIMIVDKTTNLVVSYSQGTITSSLFCIVYSLYYTESYSLAIFQIIIVVILFAETLYLVRTRSHAYLFKNIPNFFENINPRANASKSYILVSFIKKYMVISILIGLCLEPILCTITIAFIFFINGLYILRYRFFQNTFINICKIIQEWLITALFLLLTITIKKYLGILNSDVISDQELLLIEKLSFILIIFFLFCLAISLFIFILRLSISIWNIIKKILNHYQVKEKLKVIECENMSQISQLSDSSYSKGISNKLLKVSNKFQNDIIIKEYQKQSNRSPTNTEADI